MTTEEGPGGCGHETITGYASGPLGHISYLLWTAPFICPAAASPSLHISGLGHRLSREHASEEIWGVRLLAHLSQYQYLLGSFDVLQRFLKIIDNLFKSSFLPCVCHGKHSKAKRCYEQVAQKARMGAGTTGYNL